VKPTTTGSGKRWERTLRALDPLVLHLAQSVSGRRAQGGALSFGESLEGTREILLVGAQNLVDLLAVAPAARALRRRFRIARVHVVATPRCAELLSSRSEVTGIVPWPEAPLLSREFLRTIQEVRRPSDLAVATDAGYDRRGRILVGSRARSCGWVCTRTIGTQR
jgi:hypothetical protein